MKRILARQTRREILAGLIGLGALSTGAAWPGQAHADEKGDKAVAAVDQALFKAKTQFFELDGVIKTPDKADRKLSIAVFMKNDWRFTEFLSPSDVKGTKVLMLSPSQMYVYLPGFKKVRRIASHVTEQGFMGMNFTQDEMTITNYSKMYSGAIAKDDGKTVKLVLTEKKDADAPYPKIEMWLEKARNLPTELWYYSDTGAHIKTETRTDYTCEKDVCAASVLKMVDLTKNNMSTTLTRTKWKVNPDIPDSKFSKRGLEEGS